MIKATKSCLQKYFVLRGRATRAEYWWFFLAIVLLHSLAIVIDKVIFRFPPNATGPAVLVLSLFAITPLITVLVRRLHDTGMSGYYWLTILGIQLCLLLIAGMLEPVLGQTAPYVEIVIIILGYIFTFWWLIYPSTQGENKYGPNPHEVTP